VALFEDCQLDTLGALDAAVALDDEVHLFGESARANDELVARNRLQLELPYDCLQHTETLILGEGLPVEDETGQDVLADVAAQRLRQVLHDLVLIETSEFLPEDRVKVVYAFDQR